MRMATNVSCGVAECIWRASGVGIFWIFLGVILALSSSCNSVSHSGNARQAAEEACATAEYYMRNDELGIARIKFREAIMLDRKLVRAYAGLGHCEYRIAVTLLKVDPENPQVETAFRNALECFAEVMRLAPRDVRGPLGYAETLVRKGVRTEDALAHAEKAVELAPMEPRTHFVRGIALAQLERFAEAIDALNKAKRLGVYDANFSQEVQKAIEEVRNMWHIRQKEEVSQPVEGTDE